MAPESGAPTGIQLLNGSVFLLQPFPEFLLTQRAVALSAEFIGNMPQDHPWMAAKSLGKQLIYCMNLLPVYRGGVAVIMPASKKSSGTVRIHAKDFRVFVCHPLWPCTGWCGKDGIDSLFV